MIRKKMTRRGVFLVLILTLGIASAKGESAGMQKRTTFNQDWLFARYGAQADGSEIQEPVGLEANKSNDKDWRPLNLPHDWAIEGPFRPEQPNQTGKRPYPGIGWYRKHFTPTKSDEGKRFFIDFDGAMSNAKVYLNGYYLGEWPFGYASFRFELTEHLHFGEDNVLAVRLDNRPESSRWYPGGGIYRNVWLVKTEAVHAAHWGQFVWTPEVSAARASVKVRTEVENQSKAEVKVRVEYSLIDPSGGIKTSVLERAKEATIAPGAKADFEASLALKHPMLWDIDKPNLYKMRADIKVDGKTVDTEITPFGIRSIEFDAKKGFLLNGKTVKLNGVCMHHDLGPLGSAVSTRAIERQLEILRTMGCNAIRTSHNPPAPELLDLCDAMGFVVIDEAFDCWRASKIPNDYGNLFDEWHEKDLVSLARRDRNHPSVIMWSTGNEIREQGQGEKGLAMSRSLTAIFHREDPTRLVTAGCNNPSSAKNGFAETIDVYGFNYKPHLYAEFHKRYPKQPVYSSESASCVSTRGEYFFPVNENKAKGFFNFQVSSYDLYAPPWAMRPDAEFKGQDETPFVLGEFVWTGFDYIGEPTPYNKDKSQMLNYHSEEEKLRVEAELEKMGGMAPSRSSYFGIVDLCGFPKDRYYIYQARWRPDLPMAHILPHWNWPERVGEITPVHVYTSGDEAELFLNGRSLGRKKKQALEYRIVWNEVKYEAGELKVVTWKKGKPWAEAARRTTGEATQLLLAADRKAIRADGLDLSFVTVTVADAGGLMVPRSHPRIQFSVQGAGDLIATGNGNPVDHTSFQSAEREAFNGLCLAIVRSRAGSSGSIVLKAEAEGLAPATLRIAIR